MALHESDSRPETLHNIWSSDWTAQYAAIHNQ